MRRKTCRTKFRNGAQKKRSGIWRLGWGFWAKTGPDLIFKSGQKHQKWSEMGPESIVWLETLSTSMPGPLRSVWDQSRDQKNTKSGQATPSVRINGSSNRLAHWLKIVHSWLQSACSDALLRQLNSILGASALRGALGPIEVRGLAPPMK